MRTAALVLLSLALVGCSKADQHQTEAKTDQTLAAAGSDMKKAVNAIKSDPQLAEAGKNIKDSAHLAGAAIKDAAGDAASGLKSAAVGATANMRQAVADAKQDHDAKDKD